MRVWLVVPVIIASLAVLPSPQRVVLSPSPAAEVARIQRHFDRVLVELRAAEHPALSPQQRAARGRVISALSAYAARAHFPQNRDFPGLAVPYFIDRVTGVRCAVAQLMDETGASGLVHRIASQDNNVWVAELAGDAGVAQWLATNGLTLAEAARIQVPYMMEESRMTQTFGSTGRAYAVGTAVVGVPALITTYWNARAKDGGHRRLGTVVGLTTGALAVGYGARAATDASAPGYVAAVSLVGGAASSGFAISRLFRHRDDSARESRHRVASLEVAPLMSARSGISGVHVAMRF